LSATTLTVNGTLQLDATNTFSDVVVTTLTVGSSGVIDANGFGCTNSLSFNTATNSGCTNKGTGATAGYGEGGNDPGSSGGGGGGGYGGAGGAGNSGGVGGNTYGDIDMTHMMLGSGGGRSAYANDGGTGGGAMRIHVDGTLTNGGIIRADGGAGGSAGYFTGGGGSGGSIYIRTKSLAGGGLISANGGNGGVATTYSTYGGGGGGGGRLLVETSVSNTFSGSYTVTGGTAVDAGVNGSNGVINVTGVGDLRRSAIMRVD